MDEKKIMELFYSKDIDPKSRKAMLDLVMALVPHEMKRDLLKNLIDGISDDGIDSLFDIITTFLSTDESAKEMLKRAEEDDKKEEK